jgi:arsenate reductase
MAAPTKVLFLCIGNSCRSQMAEAIARHSATDVIEPSSAGLIALGEIMPQTLMVLAEHGFSAQGQRSKTMRPEDVAAADLLINMTGRSGASIFTKSTTPFEDWDVGDPYGSDLDVYREIRDEIESLVEDLARRLRHSANKQQTA